MVFLFILFSCNRPKTRKREPWASSCPPKRQLVVCLVFFCGLNPLGKQVACLANLESHKKVQETTKQAKQPLYILIFFLLSFCFKRVFSNSFKLVFLSLFLVKTGPLALLILLALSGKISKEIKPGQNHSKNVKTLVKW